MNPHPDIIPALLELTDNWLSFDLAENRQMVFKLAALLRTAHEARVRAEGLLKLHEERDAPTDEEFAALSVPQGEK